MLLFMFLVSTQNLNNESYFEYFKEAGFWKEILDDAHDIMDIM